MSDLIDRQAAIDAIRASTSKYTGFMEMEMYTDDDAVEAIKALPSAHPERTGRWLPDNNFYYETRFVCSECKESECVPTIGFTLQKPLWDYCPNCGAKMDGERRTDDN